MKAVEKPKDELAAELGRLINGYQATQALYVAARLGIADRLAENAERAEALAGSLGVDSGALYRLLRGLEAIGVVREPEPGRFELTAMGELLTSNAPGARHDEILMTGDAFAPWWTGLEHTVRTGESSVPGIEGKSTFEWLHDDPERIAQFNRMMAAMVGSMAKKVVAAYDFSPFGTIVDIGGGSGTLLFEILRSAPRAKGILFDLPATAVEARAAIAKRGLAERCEALGGDFFDTVPNGDCLILSAVLSDWNDEKTLAILKNCRNAISGDGRLLIVERLVEPEKPASRSAFMDLHMLVIGGGTGRSTDEFRRLLDDAGFALTRVVPTGSPRSVFEARPA